MNRILRSLILADVCTYFGLGLTTPIMAIFVERNLAGGSIAAAGIAQTVFMGVKSILQLFVARFTDGDGRGGYVRDYWAMLAGYAVMATVPFLYMAVHTVGQLYLVQAVLGVGAALSYPGWMVLFTKFIDAQKEGREWATYSTAVFLGMAVAATVGGWAVEQFGFHRVFFVVGCFVVLGFSFIVYLSRSYEEFRQDHRSSVRRTRDKHLHK